MWICDLGMTVGGDVASCTLRKGTSFNAQPERGRCARAGKACWQAGLGIDRRITGPVWILYQYACGGPVQDLKAGQRALRICNSMVMTSQAR